MTDDPEARTLRVHLIAAVPTPTTTPPANRPDVIPGLIEDAPIFRARVIMSETPRTASIVRPGSTVAVDGRTVSAVVDDLHDVVVIQY